jgi:hypothetical protein
MAVNLTDAQIRNLFPTYFEPSYTGNITVAKIKQILNTYSDKIGGQSYIANELKVNPSIVGRILKIAKAKKIIKQVPPGEFTATSQKVWTEENPRKNAKWKMQVAGGQFRDADSSTQMIYGASKSDLNKRLKKIESNVYVKPVSGKYDPNSPLYEPPLPPKKFLKKRYDFAVPGEVNIREVGYDVIEGSKNHPHTYKKIGEEIKYRVEIVEATGPKTKGLRKYKTVLSNADKEADTLEEAIKFRDDYRAKNPIKNPPPDLETLEEQKLKKYLDKQEKAAFIKERGGYYSGPHTGSAKAHLGHTGNVWGVELITGDRLAYTPAEINEAMAARGTGLDHKIKSVSAKAEKLKKQNLSPARKKKLLEQSDALLTRLASQSQGFKKVTLSDGSTFGGDRLTIDMFDEFPGKTQREINEFVKKWKDKKTWDTAEEFENIKKANFFEMNRKAALKAAEKIGKTEQTRIISHLNFFDDARADALEGGQICRLVRATGATGGTISCVDAVEEAIQKEPEKLAQKASRLEKFKNSATGFLNFAKKGGKFGAIAAVGAAGAGLVKTFMNDDPTTYLSNEDQQKNMLISMVTDPMVDQPDPSPEILDWQLPALGATAAAGTAVTAPSTIEASRSARFGKKPSGYTKTALKTLGRGLATTGTPLGLAAFEPLHIAGQVQAGDSLGEIATNPWNYAGLAFADDLSKFATKGLGPNIAKAMRLGISPAALKVGSRFLGLPGLALSLGISGYETYDDWKNKRGWFSEE